MAKQLSISFFIILFLISATVGVVLYGMGYRFGLTQGKPEISQTGLLVATSTPNGAQVFINGHLTTATNNTINLLPNTYDIKIVKEGYFPWEKKIIVQREVVSKADATLFPTAPKLESVTDTGVQNPVIDPSFSKIAYIVSSQDTHKNGIYILDMSQHPLLTLQTSSQQIVDDTADAFSQSNMQWSPDAKQLIATISATNKAETTYLLDATKFNQNPTDVTETISSIQDTWQKQAEEKETARLATLKPILAEFIKDNFHIASWSTDETKILYIASNSATMPEIIKPPLIGTNSTPETRAIEKGNVYIYDIKEDKNFFIDIGDVKSEIGDPLQPQPLRWLPDSDHLVYVHDTLIDVMEYDGNNRTTIYAGPFIDTSVFPWTDSSKIVILTNLGNTTISPNLYTIGLQ